MHKSLKPIYLKFRNEDPVEYDPLKPCPCAYERMEYGLIENILFENIIINEPATWPVWLGPAQQTNVRDPSSCSLAWPVIPSATCVGQPHGKYRNIVFRNVTTFQPLFSAGVIMGSENFPVENVVFDNVKVLPFTPSGVSQRKIHVDQI